MSYSPNALGWYVPTGEVNTWPSAHLKMRHPRKRALAVLSATLHLPLPPAGSSPHHQWVVLPARQAYSHWASVGSVNARGPGPVFFESHRQKAIARRHETRMTGCLVRFAIWPRLDWSLLYTLM